MNTPFEAKVRINLKDQSDRQRFVLCLDQDDQNMQLSSIDREISGNKSYYVIFNYRL
jgi:hypothetical protein